MISIFAKPTYLLDDVGRSLRRVSTRVRAEEIANYLGARFNPPSDFENDTRIYVKPRKLKKIKAGAYIDVLDDWRLVNELKERPDLKVISMSEIHHEFLQKELQREITFIPHHHVNFERIIRDRKEVTTCGYVGSNSHYHVAFNEKIKQELNKIGLKFVPLFNFETREDIVNYYKTIDIQVIGYFDESIDTPFYHPTKIINAMSFGIPSVAGPRLGYNDIKDFYYPVNNLKELIQEVEKLKSGWKPERLIKEANKYHISKIAELYKQL